MDGWMAEMKCAKEVDFGGSAVAAQVQPFADLQTRQVARRIAIYCLRRNDGGCAQGGAFVCGRFFESGEFCCRYGTPPPQSEPTNMQIKGSAFQTLSLERSIRELDERINSK